MSHHISLTYRTPPHLQGKKTEEEEGKNLEIKEEKTYPL